MAGYIQTPDHISIVFDDGDTVTVYPSNPNYRKIIKAISQRNWDEVRYLSDPSIALKHTISKNKSADRIQIRDGVVFYDETPLDNYMTNRMISMMDEGFDVAPLALFLQNLMENPSYRAVNELYTFLEASNLPITEDGHFLAYKRVRTDWKDIYTGTMDNSIGTVLKMPRYKVNEDSNQTCSSGLHFCSREYLPHYGTRNGGRVIIVKINPRDVVAIPSDYKNAKGRCCEYQVINEIKTTTDSSTAMPLASLESSYKHSGTSQDDATNVGRPLVQRILSKDGIQGPVVAYFRSPSEAAKMTGIDSSSISKAARKLRNTAGGYEWEYTW